MERRPYLGKRDALKKPGRYSVPLEYLGAFRCGHRNDAHEYIDDSFAYLLLSRLRKNPNDTEASEALEFLTKFNNEFYKGFLKKGDPKALHNTPELYKEVCDARNAQRRDLISAARSGKSLGKKGEPYQPITLVEYSPGGDSRLRDAKFDEAHIERLDLESEQPTACDLPLPSYVPPNAATPDPGRRSQEQTHDGKRRRTPARPRRSAHHSQGA